MEQSEARRRRYRTPMLFVGIGSVCSAAARAVGVLWVAIPLLAAAAVCIVIAGVKLVRTVNALPRGERRKERRSMVIGAVVPLVLIGALFGVLLLFVDE
jgi:hypothetical protein